MTAPTYAEGAARCGVCRQDLWTLRTLHDARACQLTAEAGRLRDERDGARAWVRRLTASQRLLTCAFCGEAYPPGTPQSNDDALLAHVKVCPKHPMREVEAEVRRLRAQRDALRQGLEDVLALSRDRQAFVMQGPRVFARAEQIAVEVLRRVGAGQPRGESETGERGLSHEDNAWVVDVTERCEAGVDAFDNDTVSRLLVLLEGQRPKGER